MLWKFTPFDRHGKQEVKRRVAINVQDILVTTNPIYIYIYMKQTYFYNVCLTDRNFKDISQVDLYL